jgi:hypothetical protein
MAVLMSFSDEKRCSFVNAVCQIGRAHQRSVVVLQCMVSKASLIVAW